MANRNFSIYEYFLKKAREHEPRLAFKGSTRAEFEAWHKEAYAKLMELLGDSPEPVDLDAEVVYSVEHDGLIRERVIFDSEADMSVPCIVLRPPDMPRDGKQRGIVCSHGHGPFGKEPVAGNASSPQKAANIRDHNYNYGEQMARRGFITISPDLRVFGERRGTPPGFQGGKDPCNGNFITGAILGLFTLTLNIWDIRCCIRYLAERGEVDPERVGMMGLSQGGTMTTFATAALPEIRCADIIGYLNPWKGFGFRNWNFCGSQVVPHIHTYFDTHDVAGLIAPRPLLVEMGIHDTCFPIDDQLQSRAPLERIYGAADASDDLWFDIHPGEHGFAGNKAFDFFEKYL